MEFLLYLSPAGQEIYNMISRKVRVVENTPICRKYDIYAWYDSMEKKMTICTGKIKSTQNTYSNIKEYVNETIFHESTHIAQACKSNDGYTRAFGISLSQMPLTQRRKNDIKSAVSINGSKVFRMEHEAFWMEDKPNEVKYVLQKYCF
jgi:uncharacterized protein YdeI (BOF family)